jgi:hypothetical protein
MPRLFRRVSFRWILYSLGISYSERVPRSRCCQSNKNLANVRQATSINALDFYRYKTKKFLVQRTFASWRLVSGFVVSTFVVEGVLSACDAAEDNCICDEEGADEVGRDVFIGDEDGAGDVGRDDFNGDEGDAGDGRNDVFIRDNESAGDVGQDTFVGDRERPYVRGDGDRDTGGGAAT